MTPRRALAALLVWGGLAHAQSPTVRIVDLGPGPGPRILERALALPHMVVAGGREPIVLRDSVYRTTVIVLARDAAVEGAVSGDIIVVGGDLHVHPHASVSGRAIAIGGAVYESAMANVAGGTMSFRDITYELAPVAGGYELRFLSLVDRPDAAITLPGLYGVRVPTYDRSDGLSLPFAPLVAVPGTKLIVEPRLTYRSQLGRLDPAGAAKLDLDSRTTVRASVGRTTLTNESWIWPTLLNSAATLLSGDDNRNYFRATRAEASLSRAWDWSESALVPYVGLLWERAESVRPDSFATAGPWSFDGRHSRQDMLRANPPVDSGTIVSGLIGARLSQETDGIKVGAGLAVELGGFSPALGSTGGGSRSFAQATFDGTISFPTFGSQSLEFDAYAVAGTNAPRQRWVYVGGLGSIPTIDMLARGGDELVYLDGRYNIPIDRFKIPLIGPPVVTLRNVLAGADVRRWPSLAQATGVRVSVSAAYAEYLIDPARRHSFFGIGVSLAR